MRPSSGYSMQPGSGVGAGGGNRARSGSGSGLQPGGAPPLPFAPKQAAWGPQPPPQTQPQQIPPNLYQQQQPYSQYANQPLQPQMAREWATSSSGGDTWRGGHGGSSSGGARTPHGNYYNPSEQPLPPPQLQPRPPPPAAQGGHPPAVRQAFGNMAPAHSAGMPVPPASGGGGGGGGLTSQSGQSNWGGSGLSSLNGSVATSPLLATYTTTSGGGGGGGGGRSLQDKVAAALQELDNIKKSDYRPNTAGPSGRRGFGGGSDDGFSSGVSTPLPRTPSRMSGGGGGVTHRPPSSMGLNPAAALQAQREAADSRTAEELRTAKSIVKKLYRRNVKLMAEIKALRAANPEVAANTPATDETAGPAGSDLDPSERAMVDAHAAAAAASAAAGGRARSGAQQDDSSDEDAGDETVARTSGRSRASSNAGRAPRGGEGASPPNGSFPGSPSSSSQGVGGSSHLLFLLGERDTTLNKQQSLINTLQRKMHALQAKLDLATHASGQHGHAASSGGGASAVAVGASDSPSSATTGAGEDPSLAILSDAAAAQLEQFQSQLLTLRASLSSRLRAQMHQLTLSLSQAGEPLPAGRVKAYIADLERWLVWESSWRGVEKAALNAQLLRAEKQAQESWVRARILEAEVAELQTRIHHMDAKTRNIDTQLAAALERNKVLETDNMRLRR